MDEYKYLSFITKNFQLILNIEKNVIWNILNFQGYVWSTFFKKHFLITNVYKYQSSKNVENTTHLVICYHSLENIKYSVKVSNIYMYNHFSLEYKEKEKKL